MTPTISKQIILIPSAGTLKIQPSRLLNHQALWHISSNIYWRYYLEEHWSALQFLLIITSWVCEWRWDAWSTSCIQEFWPNCHKDEPLVNKIQIGLMKLCTCTPSFAGFLRPKVITCQVFDSRANKLNASCSKEISYWYVRRILLSLAKIGLIDVTGATHNRVALNFRLTREEKRYFLELIVRMEKIWVIISVK